MKAWIGSALVHGTVVLVAWLTAVVEPRPLEFVTYEINMVSAEQLEEFVVETPDPAPPPAVEPEPEPEPVVEKPPEPKPPELEPEPEPKPAEPEPEPPESDPEPQPPEETEPDPAPARSNESMDVRMEGLRKDYPEYYAQIQFQIRRCFRWTGQNASWRATIDFVINKDGSIPDRDIDISRPSGSLDFDLAAVEAVECAGGKIGPLPSDLPYERLPVRFNFVGSGAPAPAPRTQEGPLE